ncbi:MAG TPA: class D sortase [Clostridiales bacterium]|nr:class D sortase [Clostridiales bacterium]
MKIVSIVIIIIGLVIGAYPLVDEIYTRYLESQLTDEWDVQLSQDIDPVEVSSDYDKLQLIFEEEFSENPDEDINDTGETELTDEPEVLQPGETEAPTEQASPAPTNAPAKNKSSKLKAIGKLEIPKIKLSIPILEGASKTNLKVGAGHITGTSEIGSIGNAAVAAHRSHKYGRMFNRLDELEIGDKIKVTTKDGTFEYTVYKKHVVEPDDTSVLNRSKEDRVLTLITCTPLYTATHRLVVHAVMR